MNIDDIKEKYGLENLVGADLNGAYLKWANLSGVDLSGANLYGADLSGAYLEGADLNGAYLKWANLSRANLKWANLSRANLKWAYLSGADLSGANLSGANLSEANLSGANLSGADLSGADLSEANLKWVNLYEADLNGATLPHFQICPVKGSFIAYKATKKHLLELLIPDDAKRTSSLIGRKCRADKVKVLNAWDSSGRKAPEGRIFESMYHATFTYKLGEYSKESGYNDDIRVECTEGIHFFMTIEEAKEWL